MYVFSCAHSGHLVLRLLSSLRLRLYVVRLVSAIGGARGVARLIAFRLQDHEHGNQSRYLRRSCTRYDIDVVLHVPRRKEPLEGFRGKRYPILPRNCWSVSQIWCGISSCENETNYYYQQLLRSSSPSGGWRHPCHSSPSRQPSPVPSMACSEAALSSTWRNTDAPSHQTHQWNFASFVPRRPTSCLKTPEWTSRRPSTWRKGFARLAST